MKKIFETCLLDIKTINNCNCTDNDCDCCTFTNMNFDQFLEFRYGAHQDELLNFKYLRDHIDNLNFKHLSINNKVANLESVPPPNECLI